MTYDRFAEVYRGKAPWDIGRPQRAFVEAADQITGSVIDLGCGTGEHALFFSQRGQPVTGIDFVPEAIARAKTKASERGLDATFLVQDALALEAMPQQFDSAIDSGLFHVFSDEERPKYVNGVAHILKPGGRLFLLCFSDKEPGSPGPRRVSQVEIRAAFSSGWDVESIRESRIEIAPGFAFLFSQGGPFAWFCVIRRAR